MDTTTQAIQSAGSVDSVVITATIAAFVCLGCIIFAIVYSFYQSWRELKERVESLERERKGNSTLEYRCDQLLSRVSELTEKVDKVCSTQMDTSLIAVLNDGLIKELSKEDTPNPQSA